MKFHAETNGQTHVVDIRRDGEKVFANVDGRAYELEAAEPESNVFLLKHEGRVFEVYVTPPAVAGEPTHARIGGNEFDVTLIDPKRLRGGGSAHSHDHGMAEIKTAMPGKIVRILVPAGTEVQKGDGIIVVEAMKMQNELKSPKDGVVKEVRGTEGSTVNAGDVLAVIE